MIQTFEYIYFYSNYNIVFLDNLLKKLQTKKTLNKKINALFLIQKF